MIPKHRQKEEVNTDAWLMTYADMITLLLCFFVIFVSVSEPRKDKLSEIAEGVKGKFGAVSYRTPFYGAVHSLQASVEKNRLYRDVAIESSATHLNMELSTRRFFKAGSAEIDPEMLPVLAEMMGALKTIEPKIYGVISIESYTDDTPPETYPNNWELSAARAAKLSYYMVQQGFNPTKIKAVGYGDAHPKVPNLDAKGKPIEANRVKNQRVVVRLE